MRFSAPLPELIGDEGLPFPLSLESLSARFIGLFGDVLERVLSRMGLGRLSVGRFFFALGGKGLAKGDVECALKAENRLVDDLDAESGDGDSGDFGVGEVDAEVTSRKAGALEGDLESDRRSC